MTYSLQRHRREALQEINAAVGEARHRYLTDLPLQDTVYAEKLAQATAYIAAYATDSGAAVPDYVAADVAAIGGTALAAAEAIVAAAAEFHSGPGPAIEQARRAGKAAVQASATTTDIDEALAAALAALAAI